IVEAAQSLAAELRALINLDLLSEADEIGAARAEARDPALERRVVERAARGAAHETLAAAEARKIAAERQEEARARVDHVIAVIEEDDLTYLRNERTARLLLDELGAGARKAGQALLHELIRE